MKVLIVLTSHSALGDNREKSGFWIDDFASPYYVLADAGVEITIASPKGGQIPLHPKSELGDTQTPSTERFYKDNILIDKVAHTLKISDIKEVDYDAVFYPGGHGPLWDLVTDKTSMQLIVAFYNHQKPIAFVCHLTVALVNVKAKNVDPLIQSKELTGFSNTDEEAVQLKKVVPFLQENELAKQVAHDSIGDDWTTYVKEDGLLILVKTPPL